MQFLHSQAWASRGFDGLRRNIVASAYGQGVSVAAQLATVPVLLQAWGAAGLGQWALLSAAPALLAYGDFGFGVIAGNCIGEAEAKGHLQLAGNAFRTGKIFTALSSTLAFLGLALAVSIAAAQGHALGLEPQTFFCVTLLLGACCATTLANGFYTATMRGLGGWAKATFWNNNFRLFEVLAISLAALSGHGMVGAACFMFVVRLTNVLLIASLAGSLVPCTPQARFEGVLLKSWIHPAITFATMPVTQALLLSVPLWIIGRHNGPTAVAEFVACRTLTRLPLQAANMIGTGLAGPALRETARLGRARVAPRILQISTLASVGALILGSALLATYPRIFQMWTHNALHPSFGLVLALLATSVAAASWNIGSNYLSAISSHGRLYLGYLVTAVIALACSYMLLKTTVSLALSLLAVELIAAVATYRNIKHACD